MKTRTWLWLLFLCTIAALATAVPAGAAGVGETCGGIANLQCDAGLACKFPAGQCNTPDLAGTCVKVPETCPKTGPRFCGCDGKTYTNECELLKAGVRPDRQGACGAGGTQGNAACRSNADCASASFCEFKSGTCGQGGPGHCTERPENCTQEYKPVCGCDNRTYGNDCARQQAGVSLKSTGECPASKS